MNKFIKYATIMVGIFLFATNSYAGHGGGGEEAEAPVSNISYYDLAPEIVTNYTSPGKKMGFIRVKVQIMTDDPGDIAIINYHAPYLRDIIISTLNQKTQADFSSAKGFDEIKRECKTKMEEFFQEEEGRKVIRELLITNTIWE